MITRIGVQPIIVAGSPAAGRQSYVVTSMDGEIEVASPNSVTCTNDLSLAGNMNVVHWDGSEAPFRVYKAVEGTYGFIGETNDKRLIDANILPDISKQPPSA
ncbi:MAG TPA: hypothetical protein VJM09_02270 [Sphingobium sp.]|nr:hypothetical protein [Sphingobium sp.]